MNKCDYSPSISIVTPTLKRPDHVKALLENLSQQSYLPVELILVDGAPMEVKSTEEVVNEMILGLPFNVNYIRHGGGTAIQRNVGLEAVEGDLVAFIDDDIRLEPDFFAKIVSVYAEDQDKVIGGITGYITNQYLDINKSFHWRVYRRLKLFKTYEPGKYDYETGYPINRYLQPPHDGIREIDFMGAGCGVWRREVIDRGLRFADFFVGYGVLEDAHFALRARKQWVLLECGSAHCIHLHTKSGRENARLVARKTAENYRYVFMDIIPKRSWKQEFRFWRVQFFDLGRFFVYALIHPTKNNWLTLLGKIEGILHALSMKPTQIRSMK